MGVLYEAGDDVAELLVPFVPHGARPSSAFEGVQFVEHLLKRMRPLTPPEEAERFRQI